MNPYEEQLVEKGYSLQELRQPGKPLTLEEANKHGFQTIEGYREAIHDFLNEQ